MKDSRKKFRPPSPGSSSARTTLKLKIEDLNESGEGVAFYERHKIHVEKVLPGEAVLVEYRPDRSRKDRIRLLKILEASPDRVEAPCQFFSECGGCQLQHLEYGGQLRFKQQQIQRLLLPYPALKQIIVHPAEGMPEPFYYRNKTQVPWQLQRGEAVFGLFRSGTHQVVAVDRCLVESRDANRALQIIREWANRFQIPIYDETRREGILRHAVIRRGAFTSHLMVVLVAATTEVPHWQALLQELKNGLPSLNSVQINLNPHDTNAILGEENIVIWGEPFIEERIGRNRFRIYPGTFFQVNSVQMIRLLDTLTRQVEFRPGDTVYDLFCGVGTISLHLAGIVKRVIGIESNPEAVSAALRNSAENKIGNAEFYSGDARRKFAELLAQGLKPDIIIVDPPRKGLEEMLIRDICASAARSVVYVSCNPKTLVRDLDIFDQAGYRSREIFPFDMFPQTYHAECLTVLSRPDH